MCRIKRTELFPLVAVYDSTAVHYGMSGNR